MNRNALACTFSYQSFERTCCEGQSNWSKLYSISIVFDDTILYLYGSSRCPPSIGFVRAGHCRICPHPIMLAFLLRSWRWISAWDVPVQPVAQRCKSILASHWAWILVAISVRRLDLSIYSGVALQNIHWCFHWFLVLFVLWFHIQEMLRNSGFCQVTELPFGICFVFHFSK